MDPQEQLKWCMGESAIVWFTRGVVKVKVRDFTGAINGQTLAEVIAKIESLREGRKIMLRGL